MRIPITFLGTGHAIPTEKKNHTGILIQYLGENILVDCGEGIQRQYRKAHINPCKLTRILITHWHGDHILGLPGLMQTLVLNGYNKTLYIYGPPKTKEFMKKMMDFFIPFGKIKIEVKEVSSGKFLETPDFILEASPMQHSAKCNAYSLSEKPKLRLDKSKIKKLKIPKGPLLGKLQQGKNIKLGKKTIKASQVTYKTIPKKVTAILDTKPNPNCIKIAKKADLLIAEAVFNNQDKDLAIKTKHLTAEQAAEIAKKAKVKKLLLTHISQRYATNENLLLNQAKKRFKNTTLAKDLMKVTI